MRYQYRILLSHADEAHMEEVANSMGSAGWRLVAIVSKGTGLVLMFFETATEGV